MSSIKTGAPPGTLIYTGIENLARIKISVIEYDEANCYETEFKDIDEYFKLHKRNLKVTWIKIIGIHRIDIIEKIGKEFLIHPLTLEDIMNNNQRPKFEDYDVYTISIFKMLYLEYGKFAYEQLSIILTESIVITFQEREGGPFETIRDRILTAKGRVRKCAADYLMYVLSDTIVDSYFNVVEKLAERIEALEDEVFKESSNTILKQLHKSKRHMLEVRKVVFPVREMVSDIQRTENALITDGTKIYIRDVYDHVIRILDSVDSFRDTLTVLLDIHFSFNSSKMNEVIKVLTMISTIFIPNTFIAGLYGMNFKFMPELEQPWGYPLVLGIMAAITTGMIFFFKKKKWL